MGVGKELCKISDSIFVLSQNSCFGKKRAFLVGIRRSRWRKTLGNPDRSAHGLSKADKLATSSGERLKDMVGALETVHSQPRLQPESGEGVEGKRPIWRLGIVLLVDSLSSGIRPTHPRASPLTHAVGLVV